MIGRQATLRASPSKSVTHRALVAAALASGTSRLLDPLVADDTLATRDGLVSLGVPIHVEECCWRVEGSGGVVPGGGEIDAGASGTTLRFLLAVAALGATPSRLGGVPRLAERPVDELQAAILGLGGSARRLGAGETAFLEAGGKAPMGGLAEVAGGRSSQFASALLLVASRLPRGLELVLHPPVVSRPYIELTAEVLASFGVPVTGGGDRFRVEPCDYLGRSYRIEGDHSSASYFFAAAAILPMRIRIEGLFPRSTQADAMFLDLLRGLGSRVHHGTDWIEVEGAATLPPFDVSLRAAPDLAPTAAVLALFSEGACTLRDLGHLRHKESDRLSVLEENLCRLGRPATVVGDALQVGPPAGSPRPEGVSIRTASDHRIAMAFAVAGLRFCGLTLDDPGCVTKSYPCFWADLGRLGRPAGSP